MLLNVLSSNVRSIPMTDTLVFILLNTLIQQHGWSNIKCLLKMLIPQRKFVFKLYLALCMYLISSNV